MHSTTDPPAVTGIKQGALSREDNPVGDARLLAVPLATLVLALVVPLVVGSVSPNGYSPYVPLVFTSVRAGMLVNVVLTLALIRPYRRAVVGYASSVAAAVRCRFKETPVKDRGISAVVGDQGNITRVGPMTRLARGYTQ